MTHYHKRRLLVLFIVFKLPRDILRAEITRQVMPKKIRELIQDLRKAGFYEISGGGKGSHRKFAHDRYRGVVTLSGNFGNDAKPYQEKQVQDAMKEVKK